MFTSADLLPIDAYASQRADQCSRMEAHAKARSIALGPQATLAFEDAITLRHQLQEHLFAARVTDPAEIQRALDQFLRWLPTTSSVSATLCTDSTANSAIQTAQFEQADLSGIEQRVYAEVEGLGRRFGRHAAPAEMSVARAQARSFRMRFEFSAEQISCIRAGAEFGFGIDDDRMRVGHSLKRSTRALLLADLG